MQRASSFPRVPRSSSLSSTGPKDRQPRLAGVTAAEPRTRTSETHPITVSWVHRPSSGEDKGRIGLCYCPGKNVVRDGVVWKRSLREDVAALRNRHGIGVIVCLLSDAELRSLGVDRNYATIVESEGFELLRLPIVEMFAPDSLDPALSLTRLLAQSVKAGQSAAIHCRGGVGRAGMLGACMLLLLGEAKSATEAITLVRRRRCKTAVESRSQEKFVALFAERIGRKPQEHKGSLQPLTASTSEAQEPNSENKSSQDTVEVCDGAAVKAGGQLECDTLVMTHGAETRAAR